jgi:hypothetical protein
VQPYLHFPHAFVTWGLGAKIIFSLGWLQTHWTWWHFYFESATHHQPESRHDSSRIQIAE